MTQTITTIELQTQSARLTELRMVVKELVQEQKMAKKSKLTATKEAMPQLQSQISLNRNLISKYGNEIQAIRDMLSTIPYGLSTTVSKAKALSRELDKVKAAYKTTTQAQRDLKQAIQSSTFGTVESLSDAQKEKHQNAKVINKLTQKRSTLKKDYKVLSDILYFQDKEQKAA